MELGGLNLVLALNRFAYISTEMVSELRWHHVLYIDFAINNTKIMDGGGVMIKVTMRFLTDSYLEDLVCLLEQALGCLVSCMG